MAIYTLLTWILGLHMLTYIRIYALAIHAHTAYAFWGIHMHCMYVCIVSAQIHAI